VNRRKRVRKLLSRGVNVGAILLLILLLSSNVFADTVPIPEVTIMWSGDGGG
jgi:hypothetical protein